MRRAASGRAQEQHSRRYPYNISFTTAASLGDCDVVPAPSGCSGFFAEGGTLTVTRVTPTFEATFTLNMLRDGSNLEGPPGDPIAGEVSGCISVPNP